jgi:hypothetical protein
MRFFIGVFFTEFFIMDKIKLDAIWNLQSVLRYSRDWMRREQDRYNIHPVIITLMTEVARPNDWHRILLEYPHISVSDTARVAYTRDDKAGCADRQIITTLGKYIRERWSTDDLPDHVLRQHVDTYVVRNTASCEWLEDDVHEFIEAVQHGPRSCMRWDDFDGDDDYHPYRCYDPKYGWRMAVRRNGHKQIVGRALAISNEQHGQVFVRSFKADGDDPDGGGYSHSDEKLEAFLIDEGYKKLTRYPEGVKLYTRKLRSGEYLAPYVDGDRCHAGLGMFNDEYFFSLNDEGNFSLRETNGSAEESERSTCDCCGASFDDDDLRTVGIHEDARVCDSCCDENYTYVENATRWGGCFVYSDDVFESVEGDTLIDSARCLDGYTRLDNGQHEGLYTQDDNAVCDVNGEYWHTDDIGGDLVCLCEGSTHSGEYIARGDAIKDIDDNYWHEDDVGADITQVDAGMHEGEYVCTDDTVTDSNGTIWHTDDVDVHIKQSALDPTVYVAIDQLEITEGETE